METVDSYLCDKHELCSSADAYPCGDMILLTRERDSMSDFITERHWDDVLDSLLKGIDYEYVGCCLDVSDDSEIEQKYRWNILIRIKYPSVVGTAEDRLMSQDLAKSLLTMAKYAFFKKVQVESLHCPVQLLNEFYAHPLKEGTTSFGDKEFGNTLLSKWKLNLVKPPRHYAFVQDNLFY